MNTFYIMPLKLFFHQTTPPGPIRGSLEPFLMLAIIYAANQVSF